MTKTFREYAQALITDLNLLPALNIEADVPAEEVIKKIRSTNHGVASVVDGEKLVGHIFERQIVTRYAEAKTARDLSEVLLFYLTESSTVEDAMRMATIKNLYYLPILNDAGLAISYLSVRSLIEFILEKSENDIESFGSLFEWETFCCDEHPGDITISGTSNNDVPLNNQYYLRPLQVLDSSHLWSVDVGDTVRDAQKVIIERDVGVVAVTEFGTNIVGVLSERDFLTRISLDPVEDALDASITKYYTKGPDTMQFGHRICYAVNNIVSRGYRNVIIVDADKIPVAFVSMVDILRFAIKSLLD
ncbi:MAG: CBS domain-containing protein [Bacteriovoracaceae bacterium]|nr:CBS domain-containing protein [Bacteriovoracaceae bacterium]